MPTTARGTMRLAEAIDAARTGDIWLFRGKQLASRAIRVATNAPVNHVAMAVALDDLPPLLWHTELGRSLVDVWTGEAHRGAQLNRLDEAFAVWTGKYRERAYLRQLDTELTRAMEDELLKVIAAYDGRAFPRTRALSWMWLRGRVRRQASNQAVYCAQLLAITYEKMGLLGTRRPTNWYDPGRFWSGTASSWPTAPSSGARSRSCPTTQPALSLDSRRAPNTRRATNRRAAPDAPSVPGAPRTVSLRRARRDAGAAGSVSRRASRSSG